MWLSSNSHRSSTPNPKNIYRRNLIKIRIHTQLYIHTQIEREGDVKGYRRVFSGRVWTLSRKSAVKTVRERIKIEKRNRSESAYI